MEVALWLYYKTFFIYRTCMRRAPARPARGSFFPNCCAAVREHDLRAPRCNATPTEHFLHTSHCALHNPHSTLAVHTPHFISSHLISSELFSSHFMSSHNISAQFFLTIFLLSEHSSSFLISPKLSLTGVREVNPY